MARPQNSNKGRHAKQQYQVPSASGNGILFDAYSSSTVLVYANSTGLTIAGSVKLNGAKYVGANSTGYILTSAAAKPTARSSAKFSQLTNTTGNAILVNTTGTTWKYLNVTSVQPT